MKIGDLIEDLTGRGIQLWLEKGQLHYRAPKGTLQPATLKLLAENKAEIQAYLTGRQKAKASVPLAQIEPCQAQQRYAAPENKFIYDFEHSYNTQQAFDLRFGLSSIREDIPPHTQRIALYPPGQTYPAQRYRERLSSRTFCKERIAFEQFSAFLEALCRIDLEGLPKYLYPSAGGIYPVETYLFIKPDRIENIPAGFYYYNPASHQLALLSNEGYIDRSLHGTVNQTIFDESAFSLFFIGQLRTISRVYKNAARDFCLLEAGYMSQLLMLEAPKHQIGLCPIGDMAFEAIRGFFLLGESHVFLHSLLGGKVDATALTGWSFLAEPHQSSPNQYTSPAFTPASNNRQLDRKNLPAPGEMSASGHYPAMLKLLAENKAEIYAHPAARQKATLKTRPFRFGVVTERAVPSRENWVTLARKAEDLGYATLLVPDHFITEFPPLTALMAAADATKTLRIGSFVFDNDFRHPALLAKEVAALDLLSDGRFEFGIWAGWHQPEYKSAGLPFDRAGVRINRLEEALKIIKQFFTEETVTFTGDHYTVTDLVALPKPLQRPHPPILMGGGGKKLLTLAGQEADIIGLSPRVNDGGMVDPFERTEAALAQKVEWVRQAAGERFATVELNIFPTDVIIAQDQPQAAEQYMCERGLSGVATEQLVASPYVLIGTTEQLVERIQRWREQFGISYLAIKLEDMEKFAPIVARLANT